MSIKLVPFQTNFNADGTSTVYSFDLSRDPVGLGASTPMPEFDILKTLPTGVVFGGSATYSITGAVVTITYGAAPAAGLLMVSGYFTFP